MYTNPSASQSVRYVREALASTIAPEVHSDKAKVVLAMMQTVLLSVEKRIPVEVKYRRHRDTLGLRSFLEKTHYNAPFAVLVTMLDGAQIPDPRIVPVSLRSLLLIR